MKSGAKNSSKYLVYEPLTLNALIKPPKTVQRGTPISLCGKLASHKEVKKVELILGPVTIIDLTQEQFMHTSHAFKHVCRSTGICLSDDCRRALAYCLINSATLLTRDPVSAKMADICSIGHIKI